MRDLSPRQKEVLDYIVEAIDDTGRSPKIGDIMKACNHAHPSSVAKVLDALERKGCIERTPRRWRGIHVICST